MSLTLVVDPADPTPPYEQLRRQIVTLVETGRLRADERLPPLRQLAGDLGLAVGTVARVYRELEAAGLVVSRRGGGTRVSDRAPTISPAQRLEMLAHTFVEEARRGGSTDAELERAVRRALNGPSG